MNKKMKLRSEDGSSTVIEAAIIYPIVCLVVVLLVFVGFTYAQQGFLTYHSENLAGYLAKVICYPGYQNLDNPYGSSPETVTVEVVNQVMKDQAPYRYLFGVFGTEYNPPDDKNEGELIKGYVDKMANEYLKEHGFLKTAGGDIDVPDGFAENRTARSDGYVCAVSANTSRVKVFLGQNYMFANFFRMIGMGGKRQLISSTSTAFVSDSLEIVRVTDMAFDVTTFIANKLGISTEKISKISETIKKITNNG